MAYCPECGSEVAPNDVFCAYCGIGLPNVSNETEVSENMSGISPTGDLKPETEAPPKEIVEPAQFEEVSHEDVAPPAILETLEPPVIKEPVINNVYIEKEVAEAVTEEEISPKFDAEPAPVVIGTSIVEDNEEEVQPEPINENEQAISNEKFNEEPVSTEDFSEDYTLNKPVNNFSDELIAVQTPQNELAEVEKLNEEVETAIEEISVESVEVKDEISGSPEVKETPEIDFDQTIPDSYLPKPLQQNSQPEETSENESDEKIQSVLDELDQHLQSQKIDEPSEDNRLFENSGVVIPTAAKLEEGFLPQVESIEKISVPLADLGSSEVSVKSEDDVVTPIPVFEEKIAEPIIESEPVQESTPIPVEKVSEPIGAETPNNAEIESDKEGRSFTNPNIGGADTGNRGKTKLKPLDEGTVLNGRYEIVRKIGGGGMGAVYLATDKNLGGVLRAVKEMVQSYIEDEQQEKAVNDFKRESLLLTSLEHPAIPTIFDYFYDEKEARFYLVMKYISGGDLAARLRSAPEGRVDEVSVTDWAMQIADVLNYLHNRQPPIVYRDLKPSNIMVDGNTGKLMLIDFGIARWVNNKEEKGVTAVGTMGYAPPELFSGNVEPRSDIYSLGSTMFHLLTGADPQSNPLLIFDFNKNPKPRQINPQLSDQMEQILMRAVEYNSTNRFNSAKEMRDELIRHMDNLKKGTVTFGVVNTVGNAPINANVPVFCGFCGQKIVATDMFCPFCGAQQPLAAQSKKLVQTPPPYVAPKIFPKLVIVATNDLEASDYILEKDSNLIGRRDPMSNIFPEVDLSKFDPQTKISRRHARIWREGDVYMLEDLGSSNGTTLTSAINGSIRLLPRQPQVLSHGDKIKLGDTLLRFTVG